MQKQLTISILLTLIIFLLLIKPAKGHEFYLSICQIEHNSDSTSVEITFQIFTDNLEEALSAGGLKSPHLGTAEEHDSCDIAIEQYLDKVFSLSIDHSPQNLKYIGHESELDLTWCYFEIRGIKSITRLGVTNRLLLELYQEQNNIVRVNYLSEKKSLLLHAGKVSGKLMFEQQE